MWQSLNSLNEIAARESAETYKPSRGLGQTQQSARRPWSVLEGQCLYLSAALRSEDFFCPQQIIVAPSVWDLGFTAASGEGGRLKISTFLLAVSVYSNTYQQHLELPSGLPSNYYLGPMLLNFSVRMQTGSATDMRSEDLLMYLQL